MDLSSVSKSMRDEMCKPFKDILTNPGLSPSAILNLHCMDSTFPSEICLNFEKEIVNLNIIKGRFVCPVCSSESSSKLCEFIV